MIRCGWGPGEPQLTLQVHLCSGGSGCKLEPVLTLLCCPEVGHSHKVKHVGFTPLVWLSVLGGTCGGAVKGIGCFHPIAAEHLAVCLPQFPPCKPWVTAGWARRGGAFPWRPGFAYWGS